MSLKDIARRAAVLDTLRKAIDGELKQARAELQVGLTAAHAESGTQQIAVDLDGVDIGKASLVQPESAPVVVDEQALMAWVREVAPSEITSRVVTEIRPAFVAMLLKEMTTTSGTTWADPGTGAIHAVPGVEFSSRSAYARMTIPAAGQAEIARAWQAGELNHVFAPQLEAGEEQ